ncbi:MAG: Gfo/Idh/MocA family oxidoreductase [Gemmatimonadales bacterium]|nr:Gfo/Idh/MocA family oxidoreductase [Gemmatimonadales bacterium]NIN12309.1 Gfo/Idh/MocA family oxidoreductase [Gemmatimonadales bacterium]NIN48847.1 Gfo/Idh/MocA family oxidoreductase [Gemmatimonadales bacterium]NIP06311.1 Gfo/Idh/MocA family oxidoreductase [Gemmatimonadales bacterium]NIR00683.1 Gfo/Idh/MocA family oxidoreductase [Gemmatimonadales bacterium]
MSDAVKLGVIGAGAIAQVAHLVVLGRLEGVRMVGICDTDVATAQALAGRFGISDVYDDIEDLFRYSQPDAVVICTPNHLHEVHVMSALSAGMHVLCERPLALTLDGVERVMAAREQADRAVLVGMNHRYRSDVEAVRHFVAGGELGPLRLIRGTWHIFRPTGPAAGWRERRAESGGGAMFDLGLPLVDLALWLSGCPAAKRVTAVLSAREEESEVEDSGCALIRCQHDHSIFVDVSWRFVGKAEAFSFQVMGNRGSASIAPLAVFKEMHAAPVNVTPTEPKSHEDVFSGSYRAEWEHFLDIVRGDAAHPELKDQLLLHRTMEAIRRSAEEGRDIVP